MSEQLKITLVKSPIGSIPKHRKTIEALGLRKIGSSVIHKNNDAIVGMTKKVAHLVKVTEN